MLLYKDYCWTTWAFQEKKSKFCVPFLRLTGSDWRRRTIHLYFKSSYILLRAYLACVQLLSFGWLNSGVWFGISFIKHDFLHISACFRSNVCSWMDYEFFVSFKTYSHDSSFLKGCHTIQFNHFIHNFAIHRNKYWIIGYLWRALYQATCL